MLVNYPFYKFLLLFLIIQLLSPHLKASQAAASPTGFSKNVDQNEYLFEIHGSNTIGAALAPKMVTAYFKQKGAVNISVRESKTINEKTVEATMPNIDKQVLVRIAAHGSSTGFKSLLHIPHDHDHPLRSKLITFCD